MRPPPQPPLAQTMRHRRALPQPQRVEWLGTRAQARQPSPLATAQPLDPGGGTGPCLLEGVPVPGERPLVLGRHRGHMPHAPHLPCAMGKADAQADQLADVQGVTLGPTLATIDRNRGGIPHLVGAPMRCQQAMPPAAVPTGCVATDSRRAFRETTASGGLGHCLAHARLMARCDRRSRGFCPWPVVHPSCQVFSRSAKATNRTRSGVGSCSLWVAVVVMGFLFHGETVAKYGKAAYQQRPIEEINQQA